eukprot:10552106-Karenia_brevis.AAC.1
MHFGQTLKDILQQTSIDPSQQIHSIQSLVAHIFPSSAAASSQVEQPQAASDISIIPNVVVQPVASTSTSADQALASAQQTGHTRPQSPVQLEEPAAKAPKA